MGGDAAKERRRLKRLQAESNQTSTAAATVTKPNVNKNNDVPKIALPKGEKNLPKKITPRSANWKNSINPKTPPNSAGKRKSFDAGNRTSKPQQNSTKKFKTGPHSRSPNARPPQHSNARNQKNNKTARKESFLNEKPHKKAAKESKPKIKKPKHLKRKMEHLSKAIAGGAASTEDLAGKNLAELEENMKRLAEQMEELKRLKEAKEIGGTDDKRVPSDMGKIKIDGSLGKHDDKLSEEKANVNGNGEKSDAANDKKSGGNDDSGGGSDDKSVDSSSTSPSSKHSVTESYSEEDDKEVAVQASTGVKDKDGSSSSSSSSTNSSSDDDSSDDDDAIVKTSNARSRGRRRGKKDIKADSEDLEEKSSENVVSNEADETTSEKLPRASKDGKNDSSAEAPQSSKKTPKKEDKRRCIGRKPVTDYNIGDKYSGKVMYIKPRLGAFLDIGSHSDAFCHISCLSDGFATNVDDLLKIGDVVDARVIEINREKKRITVSLRSEEMAHKEKETLKATREYEEGVQGGYKHGHRNGSKSTPSKTGHMHFNTKKSNFNSDSKNMKLESTQSNDIDLKRERKLARRAERRAQQDGNAPEDSNIQAQKTMTFQSESHCPSVSTGQKSGVDLKRERKLARRAERRAQMEAGNAS